MPSRQNLETRPEDIAINGMMGTAALSAGEHLLHYKLIEKIGSGGMGTVWKARDTKLRREVALKLLPPEQLTEPAQVERFRQEAQCASALNHPNIITIHDINTDRGLHFIAMEYVRGESLREILRRGKPALSEALSYAVQICDALGKAHSAGIVHRDLKPANVMVSGEGLVKVLDFGLAKLMAPELSDDTERGSAAAATAGLTSPGVVMGTVGYMSPEQALGDKVDERSDVFSFGVVLYEMLAGSHPFPGERRLDVTRNLLRADPKPLREVCPAVPEALARIVTRCMRREIEDRYADCGEVAKDLKAVPASAASVDKASTQSLRPPEEVPSPVSDRRRAAAWRWLLLLPLVVILAAVAFLVQSRSAARQRGVAVLPFTAVSSDERTKAFGLGLELALSNHLSGIETFQKAFWVVPASDVLQARSQSARDAREHFGVDLVISGSVETMGDRVRVIAGISDARSQRQLRSRQITAAVDDSFALQDELVRMVSELMQVDLPVETRAMALSAASREPRVEDYFLQGRGYLQSGDKADPAIEVFQEALRRDPRYARAHAGLGEAYLQKYAATKEPEWIAKARASCREALRLRDDTPEARIALGMIARAEGRYQEAASVLREVVDEQPLNREAWLRLAQAHESRQSMSEAEAAYRKAVEIQPGYPGGHQSLGVFFYRRGRYAEAERSFERARELAPDNYRVYSQLGALYLQTGRYAEAEAVLKRSISLKPNAVAYNNLSSCYTYQERYAEAVPLMEKALQMGQSSVTLLGNLAHLYRVAPGFDSKVGKAYQQAFEVARKQLAINPSDAEARADLAWLYADVGDRKAAEREIEAARLQAPANPVVLFRGVLVYEVIGERERALAAYESLAKTGTYLEEIQRRPELKSFRSDKRYKEGKWHNTK